jgi:hypothetical protein
MHKYAYHIPSISHSLTVVLILQGCSNEEADAAQGNFHVSAVLMMFTAQLCFYTNVTLFARPGLSYAAQHPGC